MGRWPPGLQPGNQVPRCFHRCSWERYPVPTNQLNQDEALYRWNICKHGGSGSQSSPTLTTPWTVARQAPLSMGFSRQVYWSGLPFPSPGDLPYPGIEPAPLVFPALAGGFSTTAPCGKPIPVRGINQIILLVLGISTRIGRKYIIDASCPIMITVGWYMKIRVVGKKKRTKCEYNKEIWSSPGKILLKIGNTKKIKFSWGSSIAEKTILKCTFHSTVLVWSSFLEIIIDL